MRSNTNQGRLIVLLLLTLTLTLLLTACAAQPGSSGETQLVTDLAGRQVEIAAQCSRIACIDSWSGEAMVLLGAGQQMAACPNGVKRNILLQQLYPDLPQVATVQSDGSINAEALLELDVDVILIKEAFLAREAELTKIERLGLPYLVIAYDEMDDQIAAFRLLSQVVGGEPAQKAQQIASYYESVIALTAERTAAIPPEQRLRVYHSINEAVRTDGDDSIGADWIAAAACVNVSVGQGLVADDSNYYCTPEQIFLWDPDVIVCNDAAAKDYFLSSETFAGLRAVRQGQVYNIPVGASRWGHTGSVETYLALLWLDCLLYPQQFADLDAEREIRDYYTTLIGLSLDDATWQQIVSGVGIR